MSRAGLLAGMKGEVAFLTKGQKIVGMIISLVTIYVMGIKSFVGAAAFLALISITLLDMITNSLELAAVWIGATLPVGMAFPANMVVFPIVPGSASRFTLLLPGVFSTFWDIVMMRREKELSHFSVSVVKREGLPTTTDTDTDLVVTGGAKSIFSGSVRNPTHTLTWATTCGAFHSSIHGNIIERSSYYGKS
jgi:hypothetical protein